MWTFNKLFYKKHSHALYNTQVPMLNITDLATMADSLSRYRRDWQDKALYFCEISQEFTLYRYMALHRISRLTSIYALKNRTIATIWEHNMCEDVCYSLSIQLWYDMITKLLRSGGKLHLFLVCFNFLRREMVPMADLQMQRDVVRRRPEHHPW